MLGFLGVPASLGSVCILLTPTQFPSLLCNKHKSSWFVMLGQPTGWREAGTIESRVLELRVWTLKKLDGVFFWVGTVHRSRTIVRYIDRIHVSRLPDGQRILPNVLSRINSPRLGLLTLQQTWALHEDSPSWTVYCAGILPTWFHWNSLWKNAKLHSLML